MMKKEIFLKQQKGSSLLEALIAVLILAFGVLGMAGVQTRALAESKTSSSRSIASALIDDMYNRMIFNKDSINSYAFNWGDSANTSADCKTRLCNASDLAAFDIKTWITQVRGNLPNGDARIFRPDPALPEIGIVIAWNANEGKAAKNNAQYTKPFEVNGVNCPTNSICHVVYVRF